MRTELEPLGRSYDVVVANPPYMGSSNMDKWLAAWVKSKYKEVCRDLCTCFIKRGMSLAKERGYEALITSDTCMYLSSFEQMRKTLIERTTIIAFIDTRGSNAHPDVFDANAGWVLWNAHSQSERGAYFKLNHPIAEKSERLLEALADPACGWFYRRDADTFRQIPGAPIAYQIDAGALCALSSTERINVFCRIAAGITTGNNELFVRNWWEISRCNCDLECESLDAVRTKTTWYPCDKGGQFRRWYGNREEVVNFSIVGQKKMREQPGYRPVNLDYQFLKCCSWSDITSDRVSFRLNGGKALVVRASSCAYSTTGGLSLLAAFFNSTVSSYLLSVLNPTLNCSAGVVSSLPSIPIGEESEKAGRMSSLTVALSKADYDSFETSWEFKHHPLI